MFIKVNGIYFVRRLSVIRDFILGWISNVFRLCFDKCRGRGGEFNFVKDVFVKIVL